MLVTLLTLAVGAALVPTLAARLDTPAVHHVAALSDVTAVVLLLVYAASIPFWLRGGATTSKPMRRRASRRATLLPPWPARHGRRPLHLQDLPRAAGRSALPSPCWQLPASRRDLSRTGSSRR